MNKSCRTTQNAKYRLMPHSKHMFSPVITPVREHSLISLETKRLELEAMAHGGGRGVGGVAMNAEPGSRGPMVLEWLTAE